MNTDNKKKTETTTKHNQKYENGNYKIRNDYRSKEISEGVS